MAYRRVDQPPDWEALTNQKVRVYRNLLTGWLTLQIWVKGEGWRVAGCTQTCLLRQVSLHVDLKKYHWIQKHQRRTVCAWAVGTLVAPVAEDLRQTPVPLGYNPLKRTEFYDKATDCPVKTQFAKLAAIDNEVFVSPDAQQQTFTQSNRHDSLFIFPTPFQFSLVLL